MHLVSLSQPHNVASALELPRSPEFEHDVRREVTLQVMCWFGQVDDADERWKMDVEKVERQVGLGILRASVQGWVSANGGFFFRHHPQTIPRLILTLFLLLTVIAK
jgi:hypothetical protein